MKRRRGGRVGDRKGKKKKLAVVSRDLVSKVGNVNDEEVLDFDNVGEDLQDSTEEIDASISEPDVENEGPAIVGEKSVHKPICALGRVKVKLKPSRILDAHRSPSETQAQSDADKSGPEVALEKQEPMAKKVNIRAKSTTPVSGAVLSVYSSRKASGMKFKTSKYAAVQNLQMQGEKQEKKTTPSDKDNCMGSHEDKRIPHCYQEYNDKELITALEVIKKVMKMDAADPFNAPVDPIALGIPDYFDIITEPMDFGTIRANLEGSQKYLDSQDVLKDVECIWENCLRYNNKGDYVVDLMKRVKKNFTKLWTEAGLFSIPSTSNVGTLSNQMSSIMPSSQEKSHTLSAMPKKKGRHGIDLHKGDCLCAVCVVRRRKREKNSQLKDKKVVRMGKSASPFHHNKGGNSLELNFNGDDASLTFDPSLDHDEDDCIEGQEVIDKVESHNVNDSFHLDKQEISGIELEILEKRDDKISVHEDDTTANNDQTDGEAIELDLEGQVSDRNEESYLWSSEEGILSDKKAGHRKPELAKRLQLTRMQAHENPAVFALSGMLFPRKCRSVWSGPHSMVFPSRKCGADRDAQNTPILTAFATFMK